MPVLSSSLPILLATVAITGVIGWLASNSMTRASIAIARRRGILAKPNQRTSHEGEVPSIGGIGIVVPFLAVVWILLGREWLGGPAADATSKEAEDAAAFAHLLSTFAVGGTAAFLLGLWDDVRALPAVGKLVGQVIVALLPLALGLRLTSIGLPADGQRLLNTQETSTLRRRLTKGSWEVSDGILL